MRLHPACAILRPEVFFPLEAQVATRHVDGPEVPLDEGAMAALGGGPLPEVGPAPGEGDKQARRRRKREMKLRRDAERPPESFERFRILAELVNEGRQVVDLVDHKARYSLVVMGVLNAGVFFLISRSHLFGSVSQGAKPWLIGFMVVYAALTFLFVFYAVDCLRPRRLQHPDLMAANGDNGEPWARHAPRGILFWETIANYELDAYRRAWSGIRMEQINAEVVIIAHQQGQLIRAKYVALGRLYRGLSILVVLAGILLLVYTAFGLAG
jgi:hypothetical protein